MLTNTNRILFGSDSDVSRMGVGASIGLFVLFFASSRFLNLDPFLAQFPFEVVVGGFSLLVCLVISWFTYSRGGLLLGWLIAFSIPFGIYLNGFLESAVSSRFIDALVTAGIISLGYAIIVGTLGYIIGVTARQVQDSEAVANGN